MLLRLSALSLWVSCTPFLWAADLANLPFGVFSQSPEQEQITQMLDVGCQNAICKEALQQLKPHYFCLTIEEKGRFLSQVPPTTLMAFTDWVAERALLHQAQMYTSVLYNPNTHYVLDQVREQIQKSVNGEKKPEPPKEEPFKLFLGVDVLTHSEWQDASIDTPSTTHEYSIGAQSHPNSESTIGLSAIYSEGSITSSSLSNALGIWRAGVQGYALTYARDAFIHVTAHLGWDSLKSSRTLELKYLDFTAQTLFQACDYSLDLGVGREFHQQNLSCIPTLDCLFVGYTMAPTQEEGGEVLNLAYPLGQMSMLQCTGGSLFAWDFSGGDLAIGFYVNAQLPYDQYITAQLLEDDAVILKIPYGQSWVFKGLITGALHLAFGDSGQIFLYNSCLIEPYSIWNLAKAGMQWHF